jgi:hypothetical protein
MVRESVKELAEEVGVDLLAINKRQPPCSAYDDEDEDYRDFIGDEYEYRLLDRPNESSFVEETRKLVDSTISNMAKQSELSAQEMKDEYEKLVKSIDEKVVRHCKCGLNCKCGE